MDLSKLTERSHSFLLKAQTSANVSDHQSVMPEHLLKVMLEEGDDLVNALITECGANVDLILSDLKGLLNRIPVVKGSNIQLQLSREIVKVLEEAFNIANREKDSYVTTERLLQSLVCVNSSVRDILIKNGVTHQKIQNLISKLRKGSNADSSYSEGRFNSLKKYAKDVTELAIMGKLDPVIGRDEEIRRSMQVLSRRTKNNPVLIGEPGVGKTAIIEGLAQRIASEDVPAGLKNTRIMSLDLGSLIAGTKYRGEFEDRLKSVINEIVASDGSIILFIDELHTLVGAGATDGAMDASNLLKPTLARGEIHCIGATTLDEYRKHIEKDAALARRFQPVFIAEPSVEDTVSILRGLKEKYEIHHGVRITDDAIVAASVLSNRYITNRFLPDKAIDLIDEAASRARIEIDSKPEVIDELDRKIIQLKIEAEALRNEKNETSIERLKKINEELEILSSKSADLSSKWQIEKMKIVKMQEITEKIDQARNDLEKMQRVGELAKAGELMYGIIPALEKELREQEKVASVLLRREISGSDVAAVVSRWTGIPIENMLNSEKTKLLLMEDEMKKTVVGQESAVKAVSNAVRRARAGVQDANRPLGSFLFLGPTGVGKTELTKSLAEFLFNDRTALLRFDMSEYMEKHAVSRLIGAPPGYVGYEQGGTLTEAVRRRPYQVILFDEIEKAHFDIFNILLQVFDEGRLTDNHGKLIDFRNTILVLTSNLGSELLTNDYSMNDSQSVEESVINKVKSFFKPEFFNRLDEVIVFHRLTKDNIREIVDIQLSYMQKILEQRKLKISVTNSAKEWFVNNGYSDIYGARPLKRLLQCNVQNELAKMILSDTIKDNDELEISLVGDNLVFNKK